MQIQTKRLNKSDAIVSRSQIIELLTQAHKVSFPENTVLNIDIINRVDSLENYIENRTAVVYGAYCGAELIGLVWLYLKNEDIVHLNSFIISETVRGLGVGSLLWNEIELFIKANKYKELELFVTADNQSAIKFYEKKQFTTERLLMRKRFT